MRILVGRTARPLFLLFSVLSSAIAWATSQETVFGVEDFSGTFPPPGWSVTSAATGNSWFQKTDASYGGGEFAAWDDELWGVGSPGDLTDLVSPAFNTVGFEALSLEFDYGYYHWHGGIYSVWLSVDDGSTWSELISDMSDSGTDRYPAAHHAIDITALAAEYQHVRVRFRFDDGGVWNWYGALDNVKVTGTKIPITQEPHHGWTAIGPFGGDVFCVAIDPTVPTTLFAGTNWGVYRSEDGGSSWDLVDGKLIGVTDILVDPTNSNVAYAVSGSSIFKTIDGGTTWTDSGTGITDYPQVLAIDPLTPSTVYAGTYDGVFKSIDSGANWSSSGLVGTYVFALEVDPTTPAILYAGTIQSGGLYRSVDGGASWVWRGLPITVNSVHPDIEAIAIDPYSPATIYAGTWLAGLWMSVNGGANWGQLFGQPSIVNTIQIDPTSPTTVYAGSRAGDGIVKTTDGGTIWSPMNVGFDQTGRVYDLAIHPVTSSTLFAGSWAGVNASADGAATWSLSNNGINALRAYDVAINPAESNTIYAATDKAIFKTIDSGGTWSLAGSGLTSVTEVIVIDATDPDTVYAGSRTGGGVFKSTDGGNNWAPFNLGLGNTNVWALTIHPETHSTIFAGTASGVYRSTDAANTWSLSSGGLNKKVLSLAVDPRAPSTIYATVDEHPGLYKSLDGGSNWASVLYHNAAVDDVAIDSAIPATLYVGAVQGSAGVVYSSIDGAASWFYGDPVGGGRVHSLAIDPLRPSVIWAGTDDFYDTMDGVFVTSDSATNWSPAGLGGHIVYDVEIDPSSRYLLYAGTHHSVFKTTTMFADDLETGDTTAWSDTGGGGLAVSATAAHLDGHGLEVNVGVCSAPNDVLVSDQIVSGSSIVEACDSIVARDGYIIATGGDVSFTAGSEIELQDGFSIELGGVFVAIIDASLALVSFVQDDSPMSAISYNAEFWVNLDNLTMTSGDEFEHFVAYKNTGEPQLLVQIRSGPTVILKVLDDLGATHSSSAIAIPFGWNKISLSWEASATASASLNVNDGTPVELTGIDTSDRRIDSVRWGVLGGSMTGTTGAVYLDDFSCWR